MALSFSVFNKFRAIDGVTAPIRKMTKNVGKFGVAAVAAFKRADKASSRFGKKLRGVGRSLLTKATLPLTILGGLAAKTAVDFESAFTGVRKTVTATEAELSALKKELIDMSRMIPLSTIEIFGIAEAAGQLGIKTKDIAAFTKVIADLKATTNLEEPAKDLARFANIADVASSDFERLGSTIVDLGNNSATTESEIVEMSMRLAAAGKLIGLTASETLGLSAALSSVGIRAEAGGTAFSQVMIKINKEIGTGSLKMKGFAIVSGKTVKEFEKMWKDDTANALLAFTEGLKKVQSQGINVNKILDGLGLSGIRISDSLLRAAGSGDLFRKTIALGNKAWKENNALAKEAALRYGDAAAKFTIFLNKVKIMAATFGDVLIPVLIKVADFFAPVVEKFEKLSPKMKTIIIIIGAFVAALGPLLIILGVLAASWTALVAIGAPVIGTIAAITLAVGGVIAAIITIIKHWDELKTAFMDGLKWISKVHDKLGLFALLNPFTAALLGIKQIIKYKDKIAKFFGLGQSVSEAIAPASKVSEATGERSEKFASGIGGKIIQFSTREDETQAPVKQDMPISPNAGLVNTIREERETRGRVDVNFSNLPKGTEVDQKGNVPGFDLDLGFAGA